VIRSAARLWRSSREHQSPGAQATLDLNDFPFADLTLDNFRRLLGSRLRGGRQAA